MFLLVGLELEPSRLFQFVQAEGDSFFKIPDGYEMPFIKSIEPDDEKHDAYVANRILSFIKCNDTKLRIHYAEKERKYLLGMFKKNTSQLSFKALEELKEAFIEKWVYRVDEGEVKLFAVTELDDFEQPDLY